FNSRLPSALGGRERCFTSRVRTVSTEARSIGVASRKETDMFKRSTLLAMLMLGLGTALGHAAAWNRLRLPPAASARAADPSPGLDGKDCCAVPARGQVFTSTGGGGEGKKWQTPKPGNPRGATTGPTKAPGYDHPNQYLHMKPTQIAPNMEPVIVHPSQVK